MRAIVTACLSGLALFWAHLVTPGHAHASVPTLPPTAVVYRVPVAAKVAALTFDDGPNPSFTPEILRILDRYQAKATFFMIGSQVDRYPALAREVALHGHAIGNHTYTHSPTLSRDDIQQVASEIARCEQSIERVTGVRPKLFRPPRGLLDPAVLRAVSEGGYRTVMWSISADHHDAPTPALMAQRVLRVARPGMIILLHDGYLPSRWKDVIATEIIVRALRREGYRFVTIPELLEMESRARL
jgi:peptidoglycan/xylan/chitin deacetylase (PgdA/CDA1 family)